MKYYVADREAGNKYEVIEIGIKEARINAGLTQQQMSDLLEIPKRTIENWEAGSRKCPKWTEKLIIEKLQNIKMEK